MQIIRINNNEQGIACMTRPVLAMMLMVPAEQALSAMHELDELSDNKELAYFQIDYNGDNQPLLIGAYDELDAYGD